MARDTTQLHPDLQEIIPKFLADCEAQGYPVKITECVRTTEEQDALYAKGRTTEGKKVTNAQGSSYSSMHQWGVAFDFCRNDGNGAYNDSDGYFSKVGEIGKSYGLIWGGDWTSIVDKPHFQLSDWGDTASKLKKEYGTPEEFFKTWEGQEGKTPVKTPTDTKEKEEKPKDTNGTSKQGGAGGVRKLEKGCKGDDVTQLQKDLIALGYDPKGVDGSFGKDTKSAVIAFQTANGLDPDGVVGPKTRAKMKELLDKKNAKKPAAPKVKRVVDGATLKCSLGSTTVKLKVPLCHGAKLNNKNVATVKDKMPFFNIMPFGSCKCSNFTPPCLPSIPGIWLKGDMKNKVKGVPSLSTQSKCICARGGVITIQDCGQSKSPSTKKAQEPKTPTTKVDRKTTDNKDTKKSEEKKTTNSNVPKIGSVSNLGTLSGKFESRGGAGVISTGKGDSGKKSYGSYQFSSRWDVPNSFATWLNGKDSEMSKKLTDAYAADGNKYGDNFDKEWKSIAETDNEKFLQYQYEYTKANYYDKTVADIKKDTGLDINERSFALQNVAFSRSVQHGAGGGRDVIETALSTLDVKTATDKEIIEAIYKESGAVATTGKYQIVEERAKNYEGVYGNSLKYFANNGSEVQLGVYERLNINEPAEALKMLDMYP